MQTSSSSSSNNSHSCSGNNFAPKTPVTPDTSDSATILIGAAGQAICAKPNKTIMHYFRDRTPSHTRNTTQNHFYYHQQQQFGLNRKRPEGAIYLKEPARALNKLALLKSQSTRDLSRLMSEEKSPDIISPHVVHTNFNSLTNSSTSSASSTVSPAELRKCQRTRPVSNSYCAEHCAQRIVELEQRVKQLEDQVQNERTVGEDLATRVQELVRRVEELSKLKKSDKSKRSSIRKKTLLGNGVNSNAQASVQPSKLVAWINFSSWFKQRPSIATLKEQNIYNDEPCFDTEIEMVLKHEVHKTVPKIVVDCCDLIEELYRKAPEPVEGIYRQCGDYNKIQSLRFRIDANDYESLRQTNIDVHTLTGVLKLFLREIKSPLVSANEAKTFIGKPNQWFLTDITEKIDILKRLIRTLPEVNRDTMNYIFAHFNKLTKVPLQQVSADTLAISITPTIFHPIQKGANTQDLQEIIKEGQLLAECVKIMIEYHNRIFECSVERRHKRISVRRLRKTLSQPDLIFQNFF
ncbi:rho GTPase-activating protein 15 [Eurosta solidaginis]|uniref:rho GTPase-activating protein 15 n=1 Tax=Eurosta solidaginis TaxID=178769 RepID=UPI0035310B82